MFYEYPELWHLTINFDKTIIIIFGTSQDQCLHFNLAGHKIDICTDFEYLGVLFGRNRQLHKTKKHNVEQVRKARHVLFNDFEILTFQLTCIFDQVILPVALYGCEIWGFKNSQIIGKNYIMIFSDRLFV